MQQKNQTSMSIEEQEGEEIDRRNTEEISLFPHPSFPLLRPIQLRDVISCQLIFHHTLGLVTEDEKDWQSVQPSSLVTWALSFGVLEQEVSPLCALPRHPLLTLLGQEVMSQQFHQH